MMPQRPAGGVNAQEGRTRRTEGKLASVFARGSFRGVLRGLSSTGPSGSSRDR